MPSVFHVIAGWRVSKCEVSIIGRYLFVIVMGAAALMISLIAHPVILTILGGTVSVFDFINAAITGINVIRSPFLLMALTMAVVAALYAVSILASVKILKNKEL